ncbi:MAG: hypothetical protein ACRDA4_05250 [Filifactoraceae bacterium]
MGSTKKEIGKHILKGKNSKEDRIYRVKGHYLKIGYMMELIIGFVILLQILLGSMDLLRSIFYEYILNFSSPVTYTQFEAFLSQGLLLVVGVELVIMLTLHTPTAIIDALLFAISRKLLVAGKSTGMQDVLLGTIAIAVLFLIRKYLFVKKMQVEPGKVYTYPANTYINDIIESTDLDIESSVGVTLGGLIYKNSKKVDSPITLGNTYEIGNAMFTIKSMTEDGMIDIVEVRKI